MRPRAVGGFEPDDRDQHTLSELWHISRTAIALPGPERQALLDKHNGSERSARIAWVVDQFLREHGSEPNVKHKWVYNWCIEYLGRHVETRPIKHDDYLGNNADADPEEIERRWGK